jgi:hypothetical protein
LEHTVKNAAMFTKAAVSPANPGVASDGKIRLFTVLLLVLALAAPVTGWAAKDRDADSEDKTPAAAGQDEVKVQGKTGAKDDECPATFGPIITDTAVPLEKGEFAVQPTFGLGFVTDNLTRSWPGIGRQLSDLRHSWKFSYGLMKIWRSSWWSLRPGGASNVKEPGPNGERSTSFGDL